MLCVWGLPPDPRGRRLTDVRVLWRAVRPMFLSQGTASLLPSPIGDLHSSEVAFQLRHYNALHEHRQPKRRL